MPLIFSKKVGAEGDLAVWEITEQPEALLAGLRGHGIYADVPFFRNPGRLAEWLCARLLLAELGVKQKIVYDDLGKPHLEGDHTHVSISHSGRFVAAIVHPTSPAGIDIELTGERIYRVREKFVNNIESEWANGEHEMEKLYIIWGAKECAFKIYGLGEVDFRENLEVKPFEYQREGVTSVRFTKDNFSCDYQVFFQYLEPVMITFALAG